MLKGSLGLHDYSFLGIINDETKKTSTLYFEYEGRRAALLLEGIRWLALYDFLHANTVLTATAVKIGEIAESDLFKSKADILEAFTSSVRDGYFPNDIERFFGDLPNDGYFVFIDSSYGATFCELSEGCKIEHSPPANPA